MVSAVSVSLHAGGNTRGHVSTLSDVIKSAAIGATYAVDAAEAETIILCSLCL